MTVLGATQEGFHSYPPDTGCHLHPACLSCPRPRCIHDEEREGSPHGPPVWVTERLVARSDEIKRLARLWLGKAEIATAMRVSMRTVHRTLKEA